MIFGLQLNQTLVFGFPNNRQGNRCPIDVGGNDNETGRVAGNEGVMPHLRLAGGERRERAHKQPTKLIKQK